MNSNLFYTHLLLLSIFGSHFRNVIGDDESSTSRTPKSYENFYGDIFDCVDIRNQRALDHPLLKDHNIQLRPQRDLLPKNAQCPNKRSKVGTEVNNCPRGFIPVIRKSHKENTEGETSPHFVDPSLLEYASVGTEKRDRLTYFGVGAVFDVWHPRMVHSNEYSMSKVSIVSGFNTEQHTAIEAGWIVSQVNTRRFLPSRFFIRWTTDNYKNTGCFNLECPGFVLTNPEVVIGGAVSTEYPMSINIIRDTASGNWWLYKDCEVVGYWPSNLFESLWLGGEQVFFGGEVVNRKKNGRHTKTEMGKGGYGDEGKDKAATISFLQVKRNSELTDLKDYKIYLNKPACYNVVVRNRIIKKQSRISKWFGRRRSEKAGVSMYYGGPGYNPDRECTI